MKVKYDYYNKKEDYEIYLCTPNRKKICAIHPDDTASCTIRLNALSELQLVVQMNIQQHDGEYIKQPCYDLLESKRLVLVNDLGWFEITNVVESIGDDGQYKTVKCSSCEISLANKGFVSEERVYCFYNEDDATDEDYTSSDQSAIPSVIGQLCEQLSIKINIPDNMQDSMQGDYKNWTITYIPEKLKYKKGKEDVVCRSLEENATTGYDFMVNDVEQAFEAVFCFDILHHSIQVKTLDELTEQTDIFLSIRNLINSIEVTENADDIITVLNCEGDDLDIRTVNPMGTNYIVNFDYYKDKNGKWMSKELIEVLGEWKTEYENQEIGYSSKVETLQSQYKDLSALQIQQQASKLRISELITARDEILKAEATGNTSEKRTEVIVGVEQVEIGNCSLDSNSAFATDSFSKKNETEFTCYTNAPTYNTENNKFVFGNDNKHTTGTLDKCVAADENGDQYLYLIDGSDDAYCKLESAAELDGNGNPVYYCSGFTRFTVLENASKWIDLHEKNSTSLEKQIEAKNAEITETESEMEKISEICSIREYVKSQPNGEDLLDELDSYWVEGDYSCDTLSATDETEMADVISLAKELMKMSQAQLERVSQPKFSFTIESADFIKNSNYKNFAEQLELGKKIYVEKEDGVVYKPVVTEISFKLFTAEDFKLTFSNSVRLDSSDFTFADLIAASAKTTKTVNSNWQDLIKYAKERESITNLILNPLDLTLRAAQNNMVNQEMIIDTHGLLGRKYSDSSQTTFDKEQIRIINNSILFTDDNWSTVRSALGKIYYEDNNETKTAYGLIAETLIGNLIMGQKLKIKNENSSVTIDASGIEIHNIQANAETGEEIVSTVFDAGIDGSLILGNKKSGNNYIEFDTHSLVIKSDNLTLDKDGNLSLKGIIEATGGTIGGYTIGDTDLTSGGVGMSSDTIEGNIAFWAGNSSREKAPFYVNNQGFLHSASGTIGALKIDDVGLTNSDFFLSHGAMYDGSGQICSAIGFGAWSQDAKGNNVFTATCAIDKNNGIRSGLGHIEVLTSRQILCSDLSNEFGETIVQGLVKSTVIDANILALTFKGESGTITRTMQAFNPGLSDKTFTYTLSRRDSKYIVITANAAYSYPITFNIHYKYQWVFKGDTQYTTITLPGGETTAEINTNAAGVCTDIGFDENWTNTTTRTFPTSNNGAYIGVNCSICPTAPGGGDLGTGSYYWDMIYTKSGEVGISDKSCKKNISKMTEQHESLFDNLTPVTYELKDGTSGRTHFGFIAQDMKEAIEISGLTTKDVAAYCEWEGDSPSCGIRYSEITPLNTYEIQKLKEKVKELETKINELTK